MEYIKLVRLLGGGDPLGHMCRSKLPEVHNSASRMFWDVLVERSKVEGHDLAVHPKLSRQQVAAAFKTDTPDRVKVCDEMDEHLRKEAQIAISGDNPHIFWSILPSIIGHYLSSGMLAIYIPEIAAEAAALTKEYASIGIMDRFALCSLVAHHSEDAIEKLLHHLTNISVEVLKTSEQQVIDLLEARADGGKVDTREVAALAKDEPEDNREIRRAAIGLYLWKRVFLCAIDEVLNPPNPLEIMLKGLAKSASSGPGALHALFGGGPAEDADVPEVPETPVN